MFEANISHTSIPWLTSKIAMETRIYEPVSYVVFTCIYPVELQLNFFLINNIFLSRQGHNCLIIVY